MEDQKVCIIGGGLTGLITANALSKLNLKIDLIVDNNLTKIRSNRTTAISQNNYDFLKKLKIFKFSNKEFWSCSNMKLYTKEKDGEIKKILEFDNHKNSKKQILYMVNNSIFIKKMLQNIKNNKRISINKKKVSGIFSSGLMKKVTPNKSSGSKYNLIIICTGNKSDLTKNIFNEKLVGYPYNEIAITTTLKHKNLKNNTARQFFFQDEILALLPISNNMTSIVLSIKKKIINKNRFEKTLKDKIKFYTKNFLNEVKFINNFEYKEISLLIRKKYHEDRVLLFGDALHVVHPLAGQGFNMTLRDLISLEKILREKINLGLDIGSSDILSDFSNQNKPHNFLYSMGIDFIKKSFSAENKFFKNFRNSTINVLEKNNTLKDMFFKFADKGLKF